MNHNSYINVILPSSLLDMKRSIQTSLKLHFNKTTFRQTFPHRLVEKVNLNFSLHNGKAKIHYMILVKYYIRRFLHMMWYAYIGRWKKKGKHQQKILVRRHNIFLSEFKILFYARNVGFWNFPFNVPNILLCLLRLCLLSINNRVPCIYIFSYNYIIRRYRNTSNK